MKGLYFYKLESPYSEDVTKNCKLAVNEIDSNFLTLKDQDIKSAEFDCEAKTLTLTKNNGEKIQADMSFLWDELVTNFYKTLTTDLENEIKERENADKALSEAIETEKQERETCDKHLSDAIEDRTKDIRDEVKNRTDADKALSDDIESEAEARDNADKRLSNAITDVNNALDAENKRAKEAENGLSSSIKVEETRAKEVESDLSNAIKAEETRAKSEEGRIGGLIHKGGLRTISANRDVAIPSYDGIEEHSITLNFDGNFGEI